MNSAPAPKRRSLLQHLLAWTLAALCAVWLFFVAVGYRTGQHEADELTDGHLASVASLLLRQRQHEFLPVPDARVPGGRGELKAHDYQQSLSIVVWDDTGRIVTRSGLAPLPAFDPQEGFETLRLGADGQAWRAFSRWSRTEPRRKIMVLLSMAERDDLADDIAEQVAWPGLWLLPVVALVLVLAVRRGLRPLDELGRQVLLLDIQHDRRLHAPPHEEFKATVDAINTLMARYNAALERERALASEIAHELRTPLASLQLHAASLQQALPAQERAEALRRLDLDAQRAGKVLDDLLALARASRTELAEAAQPVDLADLARRVVADCAQAADRSDHELSLDAEGPCPTTGHLVLLELALRNLIDNAILHTPPGTSVQVRVIGTPPGLEVLDNGRAKGEAVPAARSTGLGLGHQVVRRVASIHGGTLTQVPDAGPGITCWRFSLAP
ncbi:MAG TPA: histidine kinase dimerization/phospho-acceptor domain-containing protein [Rhizobacter sp.]